MQVTFNKKSTTTLKGQIDIELPLYVKRKKDGPFKAYYYLNKMGDKLIVASLFFFDTPNPSGGYMVLSEGNSQWDEALSEIESCTPATIQEFQETLDKLLSVI